MQSDNAQSSASCSRCTYYRRGICFLKGIAVDAERSDRRGCKWFKVFGNGRSEDEYHD